MRLKITESQYSKIRLVEEQEYLEKFKNFCIEKAAEIDNLYTKVINESIGDVIQMSINAEELNLALDKIEEAILDGERKMNNLYDQGLIGGEDLELKIMYIADVPKDKATALYLLLTTLEKLQEYQNERNLSGKFKNIKPLESQTFGPENS